MTNPMISGRVATTLPAISICHSVRRMPWKFANPSWTVYHCALLMATSGQIRSFQAPRRVKIASVASAGLASGSTIFTKT